MRSIYFLSILSLCLACSPRMYVSDIKTNEAYKPGMVSKIVKVYLTGDPPEYEEVGIIQVVLSQYKYDRIDQVVNAAKEKALYMGADCIVLTRYNTILNRDNSTHVSEDGMVYQSTLLTQHPKYVFIAGRLKDVEDQPGKK